MNIVCVGDCGVDHYLPSGERRFGGITANFACHAQMEFPPEDEVHIVSCVGDDKDADLVQSALADTDIHCHISSLTGATPTQYIELEANGEKVFVRYDEGVLKDFEFTRQQRETIAASSLMVAPVYLQIVDLYDELLSIETNGTIAVDFADFLQHPNFTLLEDHIDSVDIAFFGLSVDESAAVDRIASLAAEYDKLYVVTLGAAGSIAFQGTDRTRCGAVAVEKVVDTTGAGDAFAAGFLSRYCHGVSVKASMQHGAQLAATVVASLGGQDQVKI